MSKVQPMKAFVQQRLAAAAEEIFELFERTIAEYEEQLCRQRKRLDAVDKPKVADGKLLFVNNEEVDPEQQEWSTSPDQDDPPELPHIKEEHEELWTSQEGEQLQGLEKADITKFIFNPVFVKSEEDEEKTQSSQLHHTEEMKTESDGEDFIGPKPDKNFTPDSHLQPDAEPETGRCDWEISEPQSGVNLLQNIEAPECNPEKNPVGSSECSTSFAHGTYLQEHGGIQTGVKTFSCSICGKKYNWKKSLTAHMRLHSEGKGFSCPFCKKTFPFRGHVVMHMRVHTGEKPFSCSVCGRRFTQKGSLRAHMRIHTGEKPSSCSVCGKNFRKRGNLREHMKIHTGEKAFSCAVCGKGFGVSSNLRQHMKVHTGEKPFSCSVCDKSFTRLAHMKKHKCVGESSGSK